MAHHRNTNIRIYVVMNSKTLMLAAIIAASALMTTAFTAGAQQAFAGGSDSETEFNAKQKQKQSISGAFNLGAMLACNDNVEILTFC